MYQANSPWKPEPVAQEKKKAAFAKTLLWQLLSCFIWSLSTLQGNAQTFPPPNSCTSKDLELISATLLAPASEPCKCDGTRKLVLGVRNKTGSTRTAFALWGTLKRYNAKGEQVDANGNLTTAGTPIYACAGQIKANIDNFLPATSGNVDISVSCGQTLEIVNLYLAWTTANSNETCDFLKNNTANISPKCGILPSIKLGLGVTAEAIVTNATCTAPGSIRVTPSGGVAPYKVKINQDERTNIATGGATTFNMPAGTYSISVVDSRDCPSTLVRTVGSAGPPDVSGIGGAFTKTCISNTSGGTIGETAQTGFSYSWSSPTSTFTSTSANPVVNPDVTTTYTVRKTNTSTGCFAEATVTVTVDNALPNVSGIGGAFTKNCISNTSGAAIGETQVSGYSYSWLPATGLSAANIANPIANPEVTTTYTVIKTNTANGCTNTKQVIVTVDRTLPNVSGIGGAFTKTCISNTNGGAIGETAQTGFSYNWTLVPAGFTSTSANPTVNPTTTTVYTVRKTNKTNGCFAEATVTVTVNTNTPTVSSIGGAFTKTCISNTTGAIIGETPESGFTYSWSPATGLSAANIANPTANPTTTTSYTVTKTETATGCFNTAQVVVTVDQNLPSVAGIGGAFTKTCTSNTTGATIGETPVSGFTYSWLPATGLSATNIGNPTANPEATTTYTVTKTSISNGCSNTAQVVVTVNTTIPNISGIGGAFTKTCTNNPSGSAIGETAQAGYSYSWTSLPTGFTSANANPTVNPSVTTTYTVIKTNNANGCYADASVTVTVNTTTPPVSGIDGAFTKTCINNINGATIGETPESGFTYSWSPATGLSNAAIGNPIANPDVTTTYTVTKTSTTNGCTNTNEVLVSVNTDKPVFTVCIVQPTLCANSGSVTFNASGGSGFEYSIDNGSKFQQSSSFPNLASGSVTGFKVKNSFGCESEATCETVSTCTPQTELTAISARTTNVQIKLEESKTKVLAAPNPFRDKIRFQLASAVSGYGYLEIFNAQGQKLGVAFQGQVEKGRTQTIEYTAPAQHQGALMYQFRVGNQRVSGKLLNLK